MELSHLMLMLSFQTSETSKQLLLKENGFSFIIGNTLFKLLLLSVAFISNAVILI